MKNLFLKTVLIVLIGCFLSSCTSEKPFVGVVKDIPYRQGESVVVVKRNNNFAASAVGVNIHIDGENVSSVRVGEATSFTVPNGHHVIHASHPLGILGAAPSKKVPFDVNSEKITFLTGYHMGFWTGSTEMTRESIVPLENNVNNRQTATVNTESTNSGYIATDNIEDALVRAAQEVLKNVPQRSKIAIVYITSPNRSITDYISGELEYIWVKEGHVITDRSQLDRLRQEQSLQLSGEIDDASAVEIGKFAGADIIITGRVDGEGDLQRLRLRALDTQTAQVVGVASERL